MPDSDYFLGVERSILGQPWRARLSDNRAALTISERLDLPEILGRVLAGREVAIDEAEAFLNPTLRALMPAPEQLCDMNKGAERIAAAVMRGETIGIIGDYDVDGMTSCAILSMFLEAGGTTPEIHIPHRVTEGYGPSRRAVEALQERGAELIVTLDCGVMAHDPMDHAADLGRLIDHIGGILKNTIEPARHRNAGLGHQIDVLAILVFLGREAARNIVEIHIPDAGPVLP